MRNVHKDQVIIYKDPSKLFLLGHIILISLFLKFKPQLSDFLYGVVKTDYMSVIIVVIYFIISVFMVKIIRRVFKGPKILEINEKGIFYNHYKQWTNKLVEQQLYAWSEISEFNLFEKDIDASSEDGNMRVIFKFLYQQSIIKEVAFEKISPNEILKHKEKILAMYNQYGNHQTYSDNSYNVNQQDLILYAEDCLNFADYTKKRVSKQTIRVDSATDIGKLNSKYKPKISREPIIIFVFLILLMGALTSYHQILDYYRSKVVIITGIITLISLAAYLIYKFFDLRKRQGIKFKQWIEINPIILHMNSEFAYLCIFYQTTFEEVCFYWKDIQSIDISNHVFYSSQPYYLIIATKNYITHEIPLFEWDQNKLSYYDFRKYIQSKLSK